jgi:hypothetical protein
MTETLSHLETSTTHQKPFPDIYEPGEPRRDFRLPGDSQVSKETYYDRATGEAVRKVLRPHEGKIEVEYLPESELIAVHHGDSYNYL